MDDQYPELSLRVKAVVVDNFVIGGFIILFSLVFSAFEHVSDQLRMTAFISLYVYDPFCTAFFGGTLGHRINNLRVKKRKDSNKNINIVAAIFRYAFKLVLGWLSLLTVRGTDSRRAIHDIITGSVVIYKK